MEAKRALGGLKDVFATAGERWVDDKCYRLGAALAYYALFSIFPLALLAITLIGFLMGASDQARIRILNAVDPGTPEVRALLDQTLIAMQEHKTARGIGAIVGFVTLLFGASGVFSELDTTMNMIWRCEPKETKGFVSTVLVAVREKAAAMFLVLCAGLVLLLSLLTSSVLTAFGSSASRILPFGWLWQGLEIVVSGAFLTAIFAAMFRYMPSCRNAWRDVLPAAVFTAALFTLLKRLFAWYLGHLGSYAAYGAVGAVLGLMTWIYVVALILFFGAELSRAWAERFGSLARDTTKDSHVKGNVQRRDAGVASTPTAPTGAS